MKTDKFGIDTIETLADWDACEKLQEVPPDEIHLMMFDDGEGGYYGEVMRNDDGEAIAFTAAFPTKEALSKFVVEGWPGLEIVDPD